MASGIICYLKRWFSKILQDLSLPTLPWNVFEAHTPINLKDYKPTSLHVFTFRTIIYADNLKGSQSVKPLFDNDFFS